MVFLALNRDNVTTMFTMIAFCSTVEREFTLYVAAPAQPIESDDEDGEGGNNAYEAFNRMGVQVASHRHRAGLGNPVNIETI